MTPQHEAGEALQANGPATGPTDWMKSWPLIAVIAGLLLLSVGLLSDSGGPKPDADATEPIQAELADELEEASAGSLESGIGQQAASDAQGPAHPVNPPEPSQLPEGTGPAVSQQTSSPVNAVSAKTGQIGSSPGKDSVRAAVFQTDQPVSQTGARKPAAWLTGTIEEIEEKAPRTATRNENHPPSATN